MGKVILGFTMSMWIILGKGLQPFMGIGEGSVKLEKISVMETSVRTRLKFRVLKEK